MVKINFPECAECIHFEKEASEEPCINCIGTADCDGDYFEPIEKEIAIEIVKADGIDGD